MFFILLLNTISTYLICSFLRILSVFYIIFFALIILNSEILSLISSFNVQNISILTILETILLYILFIKTKTKPYFPDIKYELIRIKNSLKLDKLLLLILFFFSFMMLSFLILSIYSPPLEPDSRMYHFVRIFSYIKQHSFSHFDSNQIRSTIMPFNSEIIYSYFYLFKRNPLTADLGFGLLSYFSFINTIFQIYLILRHLKFSTRKTLFTIFTLSSMGAILVQIPSLQTDIVIASLILSSIYLLLISNNPNHSDNPNNPHNSNNQTLLLFLSSLSYALAIGTKTTSLIMFPSYLIILFYILKSRTTLLRYFLFLSFNFLMFSSYNYILNFLEFHSFISPISLKAEHSIGGNIEYFLNFIYFTKDFIGNKILYLLNLSPNNTSFVLFDERTIGFSFLGCFVFIPMLIYSIFKGLYSKNKNAKLVFIFSILFFLNLIITCLSFTYSPYIIRYFVTFVLVSCFCIVYFYKFKKFKNLILIFCMFEMLFYSIFSGRFPLHYFIKGFDKETIMIKQQKDFAVYLQYKFLENFKETFKKEDRILVLDDIDFYEIKQLMNFGYNVDVVTLDNINQELMRNYDFFIFRYYNEFCDNSKYFDIQNSRFKCEYSVKLYKNKMIPMAKRCFFDGKFLNDYGYNFDKKIQIENKNFYVYRNSKK